VRVPVPASGQAYRAPRGGATVHITGGEVTRILVGRKTIGRTEGTVQVPPRGTIKLIYKRRPRWTVHPK
jgi:hypothetical protein